VTLTLSNNENRSKSDDNDDDDNINNNKNSSTDNFNSDITTINNNKLSSNSSSSSSGRGNSSSSGSNNNNSCRANESNEPNPLKEFELSYLPGHASFPLRPSAGLGVIRAIDLQKAVALITLPCLPPPHGDSNINNTSSTSTTTTTTNNNNNSSNNKSKMLTNDSNKSNNNNNTSCSNYSKTHINGNIMASTRNDAAPEGEAAADCMMLLRAVFPLPTVLSYCASFRRQAYSTCHVIGEGAGVMKARKNMKRLNNNKNK
jgi:SWI/SNF-related matrix-associated actin-dependent regulator of chromatin subfamily A protein 2/4